MKRLFLSVLACLVCIGLSSVCCASEFKNPPVIDEAGCLTESELEGLSEKLSEIRQKYDLDIAVFIENEMSGVSAQALADDIYDYDGYGAGGDGDGALLYISIEEREYHLSTFGECHDIFDDDAIFDFQNIVEPYLADGEYYLAIDAFASFADEKIHEKRNDPTFMLVVIGCAVLIPLLIAWLMMRSKLAKMKTAVENNYAESYIKPGSKNLTCSRDIFLYSHVTKIQRPKSNSGTHTSSSGRTHGGGGGSF